ncbi:MAG TPA: sigma-70 family RNA polymerase sigma factor [Sphingomonas sp.]|nr:sigma-70 family RNA polymerase sigma factor [Sphingomonas sp.]
MDHRHPAAIPVDLMAVSKRLRPALVAFFQRRLRDPSHAEDLAQDLFCRLAASPQHVVDNPEAYVFRIAANLVNDHYRHETVRTRYHHSTDTGQERDVDRIDAERLLAARESVGRVAQVLNTLPERTRHIFILYRLEGMPRKAIADSFGISVSAIEKHIATAMCTLLRDAGGER